MDAGAALEATRWWRPDACSAFFPFFQERENRSPIMFGLSFPVPSRSFFLFHPSSFAPLLEKCERNERQCRISAENWIRNSGHVAYSLEPAEMGLEDLPLLNTG